MTFQQLSYLLEVHRAGSITRAAEKLYLTQSSLSSAIHSLESELGFPVFLRGKNGVTLTPQGEQVVEDAARIMESYRSMTAADSTAKKRYRISATSYYAFDQAFSRVVQEHADSGIFVHKTYSHAEAARLLAGFGLDVAVVLSHTSRSKATENTFRERKLQVERLGKVPVMIHLGPGHRLYDAPEVLPGHLDQEQLVDYPHMPMLENNLLRSIFRFDRKRIILTNSIEARYQLLRQGSAYAVGAPIAPEVAALYGLRSFPVEGLDYTTLIVTNPQRSPEPPIQQYIELVKAVFAKG